MSTRRGLGEGENSRPKRAQCKGLGRGAMGKNCGRGVGTVEECICPRCKTRIPHQRGVSCRDERCPHCNTPMMRA